MSRALASTRTDDNRCSPYSKSMPWHFIFMKRTPKVSHFIAGSYQGDSPRTDDDDIQRRSSNSNEFSFNSLSKDIII